MRTKRGCYEKIYSSIKDIEQHKIKYELTKNKKFSKDNIELKYYIVIETYEMKILNAIRTMKENEKNNMNFRENSNIK